MSIHQQWGRRQHFSGCKQGFGALPAGNYNGNYNNIGNNANFWSATENDSNNAWNRNLNYNNADVNRNNNNKNCGLSVRCVRDGNFLRAYEHSALLFLDNVTQYHVIKRFYKVINAEMVFLGFPQSILSKLLQQHGLVIGGETSDFLVLYGFSVKRDFSLWKSSVRCNSKEEDERNLLMQERVLPRLLRAARPR